MRAGFAAALAADGTDRLPFEPIVPRPRPRAVAPSPPPADRAAIVRAARAGDREAFAELYRLYGAMVHGICLGRVPPQDARDLTQEVFIQAFRRLDQLRDDAAFGGWLAALARHAAADFHRRPEHRVEVRDLPDDLEAAERADGGAEWVLVRIRRLPEAYRETLMLRLVEGMTGPEIAERTGLQADSVRVNLHRGMKLLREALAERKP